MKKKDTQREHETQKNALVINSEEVRDYWRSMCFRDFPAAERTEAGTERAETMLKATALIMARNIQVTNHKNGLFLFFFDSVAGSLPTDDEITDAIQRRDMQTYYYTEQEKIEAEKHNLDLFMEYTKELALDADILPFIREELREMAAAPEHAGENMAEYLFSGELMENNFIGVIKAARRRQKAQIKLFKAMTPKRIEYPLDKINSNIWEGLEGAKPNGQLEFRFRTGPKHLSDALVYYSLNFDELLERDAHINRQLTPYDKRLQIAAAALYNIGCSDFTFRQLYKAMGNTTSPNARQVKQLADSLKKQSFAYITIDCSAEAEAYGLPKEYAYTYEGHLLPMAKITAQSKVNGAVVDSIIHLLEEPPLVAFARQRQQITTITRKLLESPISKTAENLAIDDYLIEQIGHVKKGRRNPRILYTTICEKCHITGRMQIARLPGKVQKYLAHYQTCGYIAGFTEQTDGVTIQCKPAEIPQKADKPAADNPEE